MSRMGMCHSFGCNRMSVTHTDLFCAHHQPTVPFPESLMEKGDGLSPEAMAHLLSDDRPRFNAEYEALRVAKDPRAGWDVWDDGGLEAPGEDEW